MLGDYTSFALTIYISVTIFIVLSLFYSASSNVLSNPIDRYVFASTEGQVRCTAGNLVSSPSQCPSTDLCAPSPGPNTVTNCSPKESSEPRRASSSNDPETSTSNVSYSLSIFTDKQIYKKGEVVKITVKNNGTGSLSLDGTNSVIIRNLKTAGTYSPSSGTERSTILRPDASSKFEWDQQDRTAQQVNSGNYTALVLIGTLNANSTFSIS